MLHIKITAAQNEIALSYHRVRGLYFWQLFLTTEYTMHCASGT